MTKPPVHAPGIQPGLDKHPRFRNSIAAAHAQMVAVPPGKTLIDEISDSDWHEPGNGHDMTARNIMAGAQ